MAWSDVEEISDEDSVEEITADVFARGAVKDSVKETVVIEDSSDDDDDNDDDDEDKNEMEGLEERIDSSSDNEDRGSESNAAASEEIEESAHEVIDESAEKRIEENVEDDVCDESAEERIEENAEEGTGEFDVRVSLIVKELETVIAEGAQASFNSVYDRVRRSFESLRKMYRESRLPNLETIVRHTSNPTHTTHSAICRIKKEEGFLLRTLTRIKDQHSCFLTMEQLQELKAMMQSLASSANKGSSTNGFPSHGLVPSSGTNSALPKLGESGVNKDRLEFPSLPGCDVGSITCKNINSLPIQKPSGPGSAMIADGLALKSVEGAFDAFLRYVSDAPLATLTYQNSDSGTSVFARNQFPCPRTSRSADGYNGEISSSLILNNARAVDISSSSQLLRSSSSSFCITGSNGLQSATIKIGGQLVPGSSTATSVGDNRDPRIRKLVPKFRSLGDNRDTTLRILNSKIGGTYDYNNSQLRWEYSTSTPNGFSGGSKDSRKNVAVDDPSHRAHTLKRQRVQLADTRMTQENGRWLEESSVLTSQSSNMDIRKVKAAVDEPLLGDITLKRERVGLADSRVVHLKQGVGGCQKQNALASQSSNMDVSVQTKKMENGVVSNEMLNGNFSLINGGIEQKPSSGSVPAASVSAPPVSLPLFLKEIHVNPSILKQLIHNEQKRSVSQNQQKKEGVSHEFSETNSVNGVSLKISTTKQNYSIKRQITQTEVGGIHKKPRPTKLNGNLGIKKRETIRDQGEPTNKVRLPSQPAPQSNTAQVVTNKLNVSSTMPILQSSITSLPVPQHISELATNKMNKEDVKTATAKIDGQMKPATTNIDGQETSSTVPILQSTITSLPVPQHTSELATNKMKKDDVKTTTSKIDSQVKPATTNIDGQKTVVDSSSLGATQSLNYWGDVDHLLDGYDDEQKSAILRERTRRIEEQNKMFATRKLSLVLDLDHTLLNSAKFSDVDTKLNEILWKKEELDREKQRRHLFRFPHMGLWTKLRPGVWNFLERASKLFELHIYTMGNKMYATEMAKVLDPTGTLFAGRVISRGDDDNPVDGFQIVPKNKDLDGVLGMESAVLIIDDTLRVWPYNKHNLIVVERYTYFPCSRRQFGLFGPSLLEIDHDERVKDGTLAASLSVIERVHHKFFSHRNLSDVDVRNILSSEQRKILAGCRIVFSRVFPIEEANPHLHPLWQTAEQFGAVCTSQIDEHVTHVVANSRGTDKAIWAVSKGRFVVQPGWVEASALLYRRAKEKDFEVKP